MPFKKAGRILSSLEDWERYAGPKSARQWVDGRSAKEVARAWLASGEELPPEISSILANHYRFGPILAWDAEPEAKLRFDMFPGEPRNSDLVVYLEDNFGPYLLAVEAKADEPYGDTVAQTLLAAQARMQENPRSRGLLRVKQLAEVLFGPSSNEGPGLGLLRYQLLTACAGALCEAERRKYARAILLVHEFITPKTIDERHERNAADLNLFVKVLSGGGITNVDSGDLCGPFNVPGSPIIKTQVDLFIGKVSRNLR